jgi:DNA-binding protein H-NS
MTDNSLTALFATDIGSMALDDLRSVHERIGAEIRRRELAERKRVEKAIVEMAQAHGINLAELKPGGTVGTVYADPARPFRTWSGKGPKPKWLKDLIEGGTPLDNLRVKTPE